jgi:GAF domain-containing protein
MMAAMTELMTSTDSDAVLHRFVRSTADVLRAAGAAAAVPTAESGHVRVTAAEGIYRPWLGATLALSDSVLGDAVDQGGPVVADSDRAPVGPDPRQVGPVRQVMAVPLTSEDRLTGVLFAARGPDHEPLDPLDRQLMGGIATQATLVLELTQARSDNERLRLLEDRETIAQELRDRAIQRLFRHGLELQGVATRITQTAVRGRLQAQIDEVDSIIRDIRDTILTLSGPNVAKEESSDVHA